MALHPQVQALRERRIADRAAPLYTLSVGQARTADLLSIRKTGGSPEPVSRVVEMSIPGPDGQLPVRIYYPRAEGPLPVLVYFFGGGWTLGSIDTSDGVCRALTNAAGCATVSVGYRLAPEHKFPAAVLDCHAAVQWVSGHADEIGVSAMTLAVGGDSAGGNLAAAVTLRAREEGGPVICSQVLVYPNTDHRSTTASMRENTDPAFFNDKSVAWYWDQYLASSADGLDPLASPLHADDLGGLPPALVITAEHDPLRDEAEQYAHRLSAAGVPVELRRFDGMVHGFFTMLGTLDASRRAVTAASDHLQSCYRRARQR